MPTKRTGKYVRVTRPNSGVIHTETMDVDPDQANKWLEANVQNRRLKQSVIELYAHDMKNGRWKYTSESIKFDRDGFLLDGQHRLSAIVLANVSIKLDVVLGLDPDARHYMDLGAKRTVADMLTMDGMNYAAHMGRVARMALLLEAGVTTSGGKAYSAISTADVLSYVKKHHTALIGPVKFGVNHRGAFTPITASTIGFAYYRLREVSPAKADEFFEKWASGMGWSANEPFAAMQRRSRRARDARERVDAMAWYAMIIRGWNAMRKGEKLDKAPLYTHGQKNIKIPEPV